MAKIIDGKSISETVLKAVKDAASTYASKADRPVGLAVIIVGDDPASHIYVGAKGRIAEACGFHSVQHTLTAETAIEDLLELVDRLNRDPAIDGILVQLPLPAHLDATLVTQSILPEKDVDGLHVMNAGKLATGDLETGLLSCTPAGAMVLLRSELGDNLSGLNAVVIGRSNLFGKPMAQLLLNENATVTTAHSRSKDLPAICKQADIVVAAVGRPEMVRSDWLNPGAIVIDVGINRVPAPERGDGKNKLIGDVHFEGCSAVASSITPVPGGVGPMTIAMLMANTLSAAERGIGIRQPSAYRRFI